jgi:hypothetical protein
MLNGIPWTRKAAYGLAIVAASYVVAAFANASPVTQPAVGFVSPRMPVVIVVPAPDAVPTAESGPIQAESPEDRGRGFDAMAHTSLQSI